MKKIITISLCVITVVICTWLILKNINYLDIAPNKSDWYVIDGKRKIDERTDIDFCKKEVMKSEIDLKRKNDKKLSNIAFQAQSVAFVVIIIQFILLVFIVLMPRKQTLDK